jgi:hypothetical protein
VKVDLTEYYKPLCFTEKEELEARNILIEIGFLNQINTYYPKNAYFGIDYTSMVNFDDRGISPFKEDDSEFFLKK